MKYKEVLVYFNYHWSLKNGSFSTILYIEWILKKYYDVDIFHINNDDVGSKRTLFTEMYHIYNV